VGVGAHGDDLAAKLFEAAEHIHGGQEPHAAVHAAGVHLQALALAHQDLQDLLHDLPVGFKGQGCPDGVEGGLHEKGHVGQNVKVLVGADHGQGLLQEPALGLGGDFVLPVLLEIDIHPVHKMDAAQHKIVVPLAQAL